MQEILISSLMSKTITCISPETPLGEAVQLMSDKRHSCVIVTENDHPLGIITERDLVKVLLQTDNNPALLDNPCSDSMSSPAITLLESETLFDALVINRSEKVRHLPVVDAHEKLVGLITQTDLSNAHFHLIEKQVEIIENSIAEKTRNLTTENQQLLMLSMEDHLMEIGNRRAMEVDLQHTHDQAVRNHQSYAVILLDVDYFKNFNDHYGHSAGDEALKQVGKQLKARTRGSDRLYRYGGEEILLLLPGADAAQALGSAQRQVQHLADLQLPHEKSPFKKITISAGVGCMSTSELQKDGWQEVVAQADHYLYQAKQAGRNQALGTANAAAAVTNTQGNL